MYFWSYGLRKTSLEKCLKSPVLEEPSKSNMVNVEKHCSKLSDNNFSTFIDPCERNSGWQILSEIYTKS